MRTPAKGDQMTKMKIEDSRKTFKQRTRLSELVPGEVFRFLGYDKLYIVAIDKDSFVYPYSGKSYVSLETGELFDKNEEVSAFTFVERVKTTLTIEN